MDAENDNKPETTGPHEPALLAFAINMEFVKRLVVAQSAGAFRPQAAAEIRTWMTLQIDGAQGFLDISETVDGPTPKLTLLAEEIAEARSWLDTIG